MFMRAPGMKLRADADLRWKNLFHTAVSLQKNAPMIKSKDTTCIIQENNYIDVINDLALE